MGCVNCGGDYGDVSYVDAGGRRWCRTCYESWDGSTPPAEQGVAPRPTPKTPVRAPTSPAPSREKV